MDDFWTRVTVQQRTTSLTATGAESLAWADVTVDVEARLLPLMHDERLDAWATPEEQAYEIHLRGARAVEPRMRVKVSDTEFFDVRDVQQPPPFGTPTTVVHAVRVLPCRCPCGSSAAWT